ncbi:MAG TPA: glycine cleavage system aminomethyltransferase GcvT [Oligoflexia bacterium]|nr:glycine cleavage system aminomethyltransferase GcvT [Oligoflexia bacterium]
MNTPKSNQLKRTSLYDEHVRLNGKIVDFAGWEMPVQYTGLADEHDTVRNKVGLFDVSHMGEVRVRGRGSLEFLNKLLTNNVAKIQLGQAQYNVMCYEDGGCVDDLIVHKMGEEDYFICVNASNTEKDFEWMRQHAPASLSLENVSSEYTQIAIQGRFAAETLAPLTDASLDSIKYYWFQQSSILGKPAIIARTGYTGEDGFEVYIPWDHGPKVWQTLLESGAGRGIKPCGLGARDTLRTEMKFALYGHEIEKDLNPLEAGLGWVVKLEKSDFIGAGALRRIQETGPKRALVGLKSLERGIPRQGYKVEHNGREVGLVTSGTMSPSLRVGIAIAYVERDLSAVGTTLDVVIRDQKVRHEIVTTPFYKRPY